MAKGNRTALRPCQDRVVGGALDALPAKAGSASAAAILKDKAGIAAIFSFPVNTSYLHYVIIAQPRCCVHFVWLSTRRSCEAAIYSPRDRVIVDKEGHESLDRKLI